MLKSGKWTIYRHSLYGNAVLFSKFDHFCSRTVTLKLFWLRRTSFSTVSEEAEPAKKKVSKKKEKRQKLQIVGDQQ